MATPPLPDYVLKRIDGLESATHKDLFIFMYQEYIKLIQGPALAPTTLQQALIRTLEHKLAANREEQESVCSSSTRP